MDQFLIFRQSDDGLSIQGPMDREAVEKRLLEASEEGTPVLENFELMGDQLVDEGIVIVAMQVIVPRAVKVITKYEF